MSNPSPSPGSRPLEQLKVAELRDELRKRGLSLKGVKKDLFERLEDAVRREQAGAPLGAPEEVENQQEGVHGGDQLEGEHAVAPSEGVPHFLEAAQDGDSVCYLNDGENCLQDAALIVNNALPYVGVSDASPVCVEPHEDTEELKAERVVNKESIDGEALANNANDAKGGDLAESGNLGTGDDKAVSQLDNVVLENGADLPECDNRAVRNAAILPELDNQASGTEAIVPEPGVQASGKDAILPEPDNQAGGNEVIYPESVVEAGGSDGISDAPGLSNTNDTMMTEPVDVTLSTHSHGLGGSDALAGEKMALVEGSGGAEVASIGEVVSPSEGDKDATSTSVSADPLVVADASLPASNSAVINDDCPVQDVENKILTSVSVAPCVQEFVEDRDVGGKVETSDVGKDNLLAKDTEQIELQEGGEAIIPTSADIAASEMAQGVSLLEAVPHPILPEVQQDTITPESLQDTVMLESLQEDITVQEVAQDLVIQEVPQDIVMSEAQESTSVKAEASDDTKPPAATVDATNTFVEIKPENLGRLHAVDNLNHSETRGSLVDKEKLDVKLEPMEAESRAGRRTAPVENVKVEHQDVKEDASKSARHFDRLRPRESEYDRSRHDPVKYGDERKRTEGRSGRVFKEEGRNDARERDLKPDEELHVRSSQKRKDDDRDAKQQEPAKRMRRWNSGNQLVVETAKPLTTDTVKEIVSPKVKIDGFAVAPPKLTPKSSGPSRPTPPAAKLDSEANGDKRVVPASTRAPTASLKVERFVRPFTLKAVKDLLSEFGHCVDFWMDQIKTHCYVTYSKVDEAVAARNGLYDKQWPLSFGNLLVADFVESSEVKIRSDGTFEKMNAPLATTPRGFSNQPPALGAQPSLGAFHGQSNALASAPPLKERQLTQVPIKDPEPPIPTLDDLFRKTKAKPHIYYLPLTDEQVAEKLAASVKNKEQQQVRGKLVGRV
eukprot:c25166_g1_i1 orf=1070-3928(+)